MVPPPREHSAPDSVPLSTVKNCSTGDLGSCDQYGSRLELLEGACYLVKEPKPQLSFRVYRELVRQGTPGLCITRVYPNLAREKFGLEDGRVVWLADAPAEDVMRPNAIVKLSKAIEVFLGEHPDGGVVLLDGLEFLILRNGYDAVLQFVEHLSELVVRGRGIVLIPLSPATLDRKEVARVERDLEVADTEAWRAELDAREWSRRLGG